MPCSFQHSVSCHVTNAHCGGQSSTMRPFLGSEGSKPAASHPMDRNGRLFTGKMDENVKFYRENGENVKICIENGQRLRQRSEFYPEIMHLGYPSNAFIHMVNGMGNMMMNRYKPARILASELFLHQSPQNIPRIFPLYDHFLLVFLVTMDGPAIPQSPPPLANQQLGIAAEKSLKIILKQLKSSQKLESSSCLGKSSRPRHTPEARQAQAALHRCELTNKVTSNRHVAHGARLLDSWKV